MPSKLYPIAITVPFTDTILELEIKFDIGYGFPDVNRSVNIIVVNGTPIEIIPYNYVAGGTNLLRIVDIVSNSVSVIFTDPAGAWIEAFYVDNATMYTYERNTIAPIILKYAALHNYLDPGGDITDDRDYNSPFTTQMLNLLESSIIDLKLQPAYDGSVNMIWTDDNNPIRIVNSRFTLDETGTIAELIDRRARKDANTYNDVNFHQTELIPKATTIPTLTFDGLVPGGVLPGGGYRYFFKYVTADGAETDIIEESRLVSVHDGATTLTACGVQGKPTNNAVKFTLTNLDQSFYGVVVYYTFSVGEVDYISTAYRIDSPYIIDNMGSCIITHTGFESQVLEDIATLSLTYSLISRAKTLDVVNNRLIVGNTDALDVYDQTLAQAAASISIEESTFNIVQHSEIDKSTSVEAEYNYSNPKFIYDKLGYWKGETYELGIVFVATDGLSPVYPLQGIDNLDGSLPYDTDLFGGLYRGFAAKGQNASGVYRTHNRNNLWTFLDDVLTFSGTCLKVDIEPLKSLDNITGFFFVRRKRKKDAILQGLLTAVASVPVATKFGSEYELTGFGNWCGVGLSSSIAGTNVKYVPAPMGMMPFGVEETAATVVYINYLNPDGVQVLTVGAAGANTVVLSSVENLVPGDMLKFLGYESGEIDSVDSGTNTVTMTAPFGGAIPGGTTVLLGRMGGSGVSTDFYILAPIREYEEINSWALYSPDVECAPSYYASIFSGSQMGITTDKQLFNTTQVNTATGDTPFATPTPLYQKITGSIGSLVAFTGVKTVTTHYVDSGAVGVAAKGFSGSTDRNFGLFWGWIVGDSHLTQAWVESQVQSAMDQYSGTRAPELAIGSRPGNALAFGRYIGVKGTDSNLASTLMELTPAPDDWSQDDNTSAFISLQSVGWIDGAGSRPGAQLGYVSTLYNNVNGSPLVLTSWESRYLLDDDTEYSAISPRYRFSDFFNNGAAIANTEIELYGGDCFLGMSWKQVWHPLGISEAPQTSDITAYKTQRRSLGLLDYGFAIPVPAQSNYNFNVRSKERIDEVEYKVYGSDRSFLPLKGIDAIRGNRQLETGLYNKGYNAEADSAAKQFRLNLNAPFYRFKYPNRIYTSAESGENEFVNGFSNFKGLNFKDYNSNLGAITKLIALNNVLVCVFRDGVAQIGVDERSQISNDTGGVFVDAAKVLSRSNVINSDYGSSHLHSICASNNYVYGVDFGRQKIWRTNGQAMELISDLKVQNKMASITKDLLEVLSEGTESWLDVYAQFDSLKNEIYFTFVVRDPNNIDEWNKSRTIVFKETADVWVCETNDTRKFLFQSNEYRYSFPSVVDKYNKIYRYNIPHLANVDPTVEVYGEYNKFYDKIYDMSFDYHVIDEQSLFKIFSNIYVIGNNSLPTKVTYTSDFNTITEQELIPYTNVRYPIRDVNGLLMTASGSTGSQTLTITQTASIKRPQQSALQYGDFISIIDPFDPHVHYNYVVIEYVPGSHIVLDKELTRNVTNEQLYFGYGSNLPMRLTDSSLEEGYGVVTCQFNNRTTRGQSPAKLRGKWMRFKQTYEGTAPVYISAIITDYGISLS